MIAKKLQFGNKICDKVKKYYIDTDNNYYFIVDSSKKCII